MDVTISLNEGARIYYEEDSEKEGYLGGVFLARAFANRGHNVSIVHPRDVNKNNKGVFTRNLYSFSRENGFVKSNENVLLKGDVFFVYGLGEDKESSKITSDFMNLLYPLEAQYGLMLNSAESTSYESKDKLKTLDLPFVPGFDISSKRDLCSLLKSGEKVIAKPNVGFQGIGIRFLEGIKNISIISGDSLGDYVYQKYVPANEERRYIFLDNELIIRRRIEKRGSPGNEVCTNVNLMEGYEQEIDIARNAIEQCQMFYAAVDFRGDYVLEINGSGTGIAPPTVKNQMDSYNLGWPIVQAVERRCL